MSGGEPRGGLAALRRLTVPAPERAQRPAPRQTCEMCGVPLGQEHGHVADTRDHRLMCTCRPCSLLFDSSGAGGHRYRGLGSRIVSVPGLRLDEVTWDGLQIPVDLAFFLRQDGRFLAFYPGPSGATESELDLEEWDRVLADNPALAAVRDETEAVLLRHRDQWVGCHVVPVDVCYALVGLVRTHWEGLAGGPEVWRRIDDFFAELDARAEPPAGASP
jgi:hypothetical protein